MKIGAFIIGMIGVVLVLAVCNYALLWIPSQDGACSRPEISRISTLRGHVVGKSLWLVQYRWLRRRFTAVGTTLSLDTTHYENRPNAGLIWTGKHVATQVVGDDGTFDFGQLPPMLGQTFVGDPRLPDHYSLTVKMPGEDAVGFGFRR